MIGEEALAQKAIAESTRTTGLTVTPNFDWFSTVISQYANSPVLLQLIANVADYIDPTANFDTFFALIFNVDTAQGYGLDVWGRIVGVSRVLKLPSAGNFFGFKESSDAHSFNESIFYGGGGLTSNYSLAYASYRKLILAKALANICDGSIPGINQILINLFGGYGNCFVIDGGNMTLIYSFASGLSSVDFAIISQSGVLPRPAGVAATIVQH
jgi:hypothetical protein